MEEVFDEHVSFEDLKRFEAIYNSQVESNAVTPEAEFNYAWCLVRSRYGADIKKGICLLEDLFNRGSAEEKRNHVYYLALGYAKLKDYQKALYYVKSFLRIEPGNQQFQNLERVIRKRMEREGIAGAAIVGGIALAVGGILTLGYALTKK